MELKDFLRSATKRERADIAAGCNHSVYYLYQLAGHHRYVSTVPVTHIEKLILAAAFRTAERLKRAAHNTLVQHSDFFRNGQPCQQVVDPQRCR